MQCRTVLSDNDFPKYSRAYVAMSIMVAWWFPKQYRIWGLDGHAHSAAVSAPWPLRTEISPDSLNIFTIFSTCGWWKTYILCNLALKNIVYELTDNSLIEYLRKLINHEPSLLAKTKPLVDAPFILNLDNLTCYQLNCELWNLPEQCYL